uniref:Uncharacterized protein n=1 Tax=Cacopsylla melanoneura TaxID=428564 RepID=A0A8D9AHF6_9HEMI
MRKRTSPPVVLSVQCLYFNTIMLFQAQITQNMKSSQQTGFQVKNNHSIIHGLDINDLSPINKKEQLYFDYKKKHGIYSEVKHLIKSLGRRERAPDAQAAAPLDPTTFVEETHMNEDFYFNGLGFKLRKNQRISSFH